MKDENLLEAFNVWDGLSQTPDTIIAYQSRLKAILDEEARLNDMHEKGIEEGILKVAKELISLNLDLETIKKATGLSYRRDWKINVISYTRCINNSDNTLQFMKIH